MRYEEKEKKRRRHKSSGTKSHKDSDSSDLESPSPSRSNTPGTLGNHIQTYNKNQLLIFIIALIVKKKTESGESLKCDGDYVLTFKSILR